MSLIYLVFFSVFALGNCQIRDNRVEDIVLKFYKGSLSDSEDIKIGDSVELLNFPEFELTKRTVFYIHGFLENVTWISIQTVIEAYTKRGDHNIVLVDWTNMNRSPYLFNAAPNTHKVARALASAIERLVNASLNPDLVHIVGHSLGGQIAGFTGKNLPVKIDRISVLDAAFPGFYGLGIHVQPSDAKFVDAIHTDAGIYGALFKTAQVDFWPNGGNRFQPGCPKTPIIMKPLSDADLCSHWRSWRFWAESLTNEKAFPAKRCDVKYRTRVYTAYTNDDDDEPVYMGYAASRDLTGNYCLETKASEPFGLGNEEN